MICTRLWLRRWEALSSSAAAVAARRRQQVRRFCGDIADTMDDAIAACFTLMRLITRESALVQVDPANLMPSPPRCRVSELGFGRLGPGCPLIGVGMSFWVAANVQKVL